MSSWLVDTLVWTGLLIAVVLLVRRPVAQWFGARVAYALWLLPFARLVMPPVELPAGLAPEPVAASAPFVLTGDASLLLAAPLAPAAHPVDWASLLLAAWLGGAAVFLIRRFALYARMRRELLADATPVGRAGRVRLVETPVAPSPVAFGVLDKVIALPPGFMGMADRTARDMALAHELAHHRSQDLLANFAVQPLFALHWFTPLGWFGWEAMRRDQEAACDARVVEHFARPQRAAYASLIAGLAAGPNIALAAPMACPVLGEKSVIQRLRSLTMTDVSPRRRLFGRALLASGLLAVPLTATLTYAANEQASGSPQTTASEPAVDRKITIINAPDGATIDDASLSTRVIERDGRTIVLKSTEPLSDAEAEAHIAKAEASMAEAEAMAAEGHAHADKAHADRQTHRIIIRAGERGEDIKTREHHRTMIREGKALSEAQRAELRAELHSSMAEMKGELAAADFECDGALEVSVRNTPGGKRQMMLCRTQVNATALSALKRARQGIADDSALSGDVRQEVLDALDAEIADMEQRADG